MYLPVGEALGQVDIFVRSLGQADLWSDMPLLVKLWVRLTFLTDHWFRLTIGQMYLPVGEASGQVDIFVRSLGQADIGQITPL